MNIWTGLLFLEGAIADGPLARELAEDRDHEPAVSDTARIDHEGVARDVRTGDRPLNGAGLY